jgi:hypothetical protein
MTVSGLGARVIDLLERERDRLVTTLTSEHASPKSVFLTGEL